MINDGKETVQGASTIHLIGSLTKGLIIMETLMERNSISVTELSRILNVNKSSAYRLLATLVARDFVHQDPSTGQYSLSMKMSKFRLKLIDNSNLREIAHPFLEKLTEITNESAGMCVLYGDSGVLIDNCLSSEIITAKLTIGMDEPLYCTSLGKAILSAQPEEERERLICTTSLVPRTPKTIVDVERFRLEIKQAIENGYALDDEEYSLGMRCIAAPVYSFNHEPVASIGISAPITRMRTETIMSMAEKVKVIAGELTSSLA